MPRHRGNVDQVVLDDVVYPIANQALPAPALDYHGMRMLVTLERRVSARRDFEVPQLACQ